MWRGGTTSSEGHRRERLGEESCLNFGVWVTSALAFVPRMLFQRRDSRVPNSGYIFSRRRLDPVPKTNKSSDRGEGGERDHECVSKPQPLSIIRKERNLNLRFYILVETGIRRQPFLCSASFKHAIFARHPQALCVSFCRLFTVELALTLCAR